MTVIGTRKKLYIAIQFNLSKISTGSLTILQNWFVSSKQILEYLQTFARQSGADAVVKMKTSVVKAEKTSDGKWCVTSKYLSLAPTSTEDLLVETHENVCLIGTSNIKNYIQTKL